MMSPEVLLWNFYRQHRETWHGRLIEAVETAKLQTYAPVALGQSMDLLLDSIRHRTFDTFIGTMRDHIRARVEQGVSREELRSALEVEWSVYDAMLCEALPDDEAARRELRACGKRMKVATRVAFTQVLLSS